MQVRELEEERQKTKEERKKSKTHTSALEAQVCGKKISKK
jgi:hypothetical protein